MHSKTLRTLEDQGQINRNKGIASPSGKILKGVMNQAPIKLNTSSIPSKFQNVISQSNSKAAFGDSTKKFFNLSANDSSLTPGPGRYNLDNSITKIDSKKGSGFFASQSKLLTLQRSRSHVPGPGAYKLKEFKPKSLKKLKFAKANTYSTQNQSMLNTSKSTALLSSRIQQRQIFKNQIDNSKANPSVGTYQINKQKILKQSKSYSTFKSKISRFQIQKSQTPSVGWYEVTRAKAKSEVILTKKLQNPKLNQLYKNKDLHKAFKNLQQKQEKEKIGPGTYNPQMSKTSKTFKMKDTMYDRFGELKQIYMMAKIAGGQKQQPQQEQTFQSKLRMAQTYNSAFKSTTKKWDILLKNQMDPGKYNGTKSPAKKSHLINFFQKWV